MADIKINGIEELSQKLTGIVDEGHLHNVVGRACALVQRTAMQKAHIDNGTLKASIKSDVVHDGGDIIGIVYTPLEYAPYVEFGTGLFAENGNGRKNVPWHFQDDKGEWHSIVGSKPYPFMRPALDENREKIVRMLKEALLND